MLYELISSTLYLVFIESSSDWELLLENLSNENGFQKVNDQKFEYQYLSAPRVFLKLIRVHDVYQIQIIVDDQVEHIILDRIIRT